MEYNVDYFINFFEAIPEYKWCTGEFLDILGRSCGNGHLGAFRRDQWQPIEKTEASRAIVPLIAMLHITGSGGIYEDTLVGYSCKLAYINNGLAFEYQQPTPKQRVLAALRDVKALQLKEADKLIEKSLMAAEPNLQLATL